MSNLFRVKLGNLLVICWLYVFILLVNLLQTVKNIFSKGVSRSVSAVYLRISPPRRRIAAPLPAHCQKLFSRGGFTDFAYFSSSFTEDFHVFSTFFAKSMPFYHSSERWTSGYKFDKLKKTLWIHSDTTGRIYYICGSCEYESQPSQFDRAICHLARDRQH